jgi:hypothetical protein
MNLSSTVNNANDSQVWSNLKEVIATSSGFDKWQHSREVDSKPGSKTSDHSDLRLESCGLLPVQESKIDDLVRSYLRETLETLAY